MDTDTEEWRKTKMKPERQDTSNADLVREVRDGDPDALETLVTRHFGMVFAICLAHLGDHEAAEDLTQEVFMRAYLFLKHLKDPAMFSAWLARIARNLARDWLRRGEGVTRMTRLIPLHGEHLELADANRKGAREAVQTREESDAVHRAVEKLPLQQREVVMLHFMEELSQQEIAERLRVHRSSVSRLLTRALRTLRKRLGEEWRPEQARLRATDEARARTIAIVSATAALTATQKLTVAAAAGVNFGTEAALANGALLGGKTGLIAKIAAAIFAMGLFGGACYLATAEGNTTTDTITAAPERSQDQAWRRHPLLASAVAKHPTTPFKWSGKLEEIRAPMSEAEKTKLISQLETQKKSVDSPVLDPASRASNNAAFDMAREELLSGNPTESTFTLHSDGTAFLWQVQKSGSNVVLATTRTPEYMDFLGIVPVIPGDNISLSRQHAGIPESIYDEIPWMFDLERISAAYNKANLKGTAKRCTITFSDGISGRTGWPGWPAMKLTYDLAKSEVYPVLIELPWTAPAFKIAQPEISIAVEMGQPTGAPGIIPHTIGINFLNKSFTTVTVELTDYKSKINLSDLTRWPAGTIVSDWRFDSKKVKQYHYKPGMTEEEVKRAVYGWLAPFRRGPK